MRRLLIVAFATTLGILGGCRAKDNPATPSNPLVFSPIPVVVGGVPAAPLPTPTPVPPASPVEGAPTPKPADPPPTPKPTDPPPTPKPTPQPPPPTGKVVSARING